MIRPVPPVVLRMGLCTLCPRHPREHYLKWNATKENKYSKMCDAMDIYFFHTLRHILRESRFGPSYIYRSVESIHFQTQMSIHFLIFCTPIKISLPRSRQASLSASCTRLLRRRSCGTLCAKACSTVVVEWWKTQ